MFCYQISHNHWSYAKMLCYEISITIQFLHSHLNTDEKCEGVGSSEEDQDNSAGETELPEIDPRAEDRELKNHLLRKYSGYLSSLKQELSKKKKKGKLPKDARQKLLSWWELHYKWPYPSVCVTPSNRIQNLFHVIKQLSCVMVTWITRLL